MKFLKKKTAPSRRSALPVSGNNRFNTNTYYSNTARAYDRSSTQSNNKLKQKKSKTTNTSGAEKNAKKPLVSIAINGLLIFSFIVVGFLATTLSSSVDILLPEDSFSYRDTKEYEDFAREIMQQSIVNRSKVLFRSDQFEETFRERFPEVRQVEAIVPIGGRSLTVAVGISEPLAYVINGSETGIIDTSGVLATISMTTDNIINSDLPPIRFLERQQDFSVGSRILTVNEVKLLTLVESELDNFIAADSSSVKLRTSDYSLSVTRGRLELTFENAPYYARFSTFGSPEEQVGKLKATLSELSGEGSLPETYIDLRVEGRVFVL